MLKMKKQNNISIFIIFILLIFISYLLYLNTIPYNINKIDTITISKEPQRIANTLYKCYPAIRIWGNDVIYYWSLIIHDQAQKRELEWSIICAKIHCESGFNPKAISNMNAKGISQMLDSTAVMVGRKIGMTYVPGITLWNDVSAMLLGIEYLDQGIKKEKSIKNGLRCYYAGSGWRKNKNQEAIDEYVQTLMTEKKKLDEVYHTIVKMEQDTLIR